MKSKISFTIVLSILIILICTSAIFSQNDVKIDGPNRNLAIINKELDNSGTEFGSLYLNPATDNVNATDVKNKLWQTQQGKLYYGSNEVGTGWIRSSTTIQLTKPTIDKVVIGSGTTTNLKLTVNGKARMNAFRLGTSATVGHVLTTDATGVGTWQAIPGGGSGSIDGLSDGKSSSVNANVYLGQFSGDTDNSTSFKGNTALGYSSLDALTNSNGGENTAVGYGSMGEFTGGRANTAIGFESLHGATGPALGTENTAIGHGALYQNTSGSGNVAIGFEAGYDETGSDKLYINNGRSTTPLIWGDFQFADVIINGSLEVTQGITGTVSPPSDLRYKKSVKSLDNSLEKLSKLRGVTYDWEINKFPKKKFNNRKQIGVIAQEVEDIFPELVHTNREGYKSVEYSKFTAVLIEAVKEQQKMIEELEKQNSEFRSQNSELENRLRKLERIFDSKKFTSINN